MMKIVMISIFNSIRCQWNEPCENNIALQKPNPGNLLGTNLLIPGGGGGGGGREGEGEGGGLVPDYQKTTTTSELIPTTP